MSYYEDQQEENTGKTKKRSFVKTPTGIVLIICMIYISVRMILNRHVLTGVYFAGVVVVALILFSGKEESNSKTWLKVLAGMLAGVALAVLGYFNIHNWQPATCTMPKTCSICGRTEGNALGHNYGEWEFSSTVILANGHIGREELHVCKRDSRHNEKQYIDYGFSDADVSAKGKAGDSIDWFLNKKNGCLYFFGSGKMYNCEWNYEAQNAIQPWDGYESEIGFVYIEEGITYIGECAFRQCGKIKRIEIPASVTSVGWTAFTSCYGLEEFQVEKNNPSYVSVNGVLFDKQMNTLIRYPASKYGDTYKVPETVMKICDFEHCKLKSISFPESVVEIEGSCFQACDNLSEIILPKNLKIINSYLFWGCDNLQKVTIPKSVNKIEHDAFFLCSRLKDFYYEGTSAEWNKISNEGIFNSTIHMLNGN